MNNSLVKNNTINENNINNTDFYQNLILFINRNDSLIFLIFIVLLIIFLFELLLIFYLKLNKTTLRQVIYNNCVNKRMKRKKNIVIQMGSLSHSIE